jgi:hypothetical protein
MNSDIFPIYFPNKKIIYNVTLSSSYLTSLSIGTAFTSGSKISDFSSGSTIEDFGLASEYHGIGDFIQSIIFRGNYALSYDLIAYNYYYGIPINYYSGSTLSNMGSLSQTLDYLGLIYIS